MLYGLLLALFIFICFALILLVLIQKGKGSMGLGAMGGGTQMLFGGSGGQDLFQKITWALGAIFMLGSLLLGLMKSSSLHDVRYIKIKDKQELETPAQQESSEPTEETPVPVAPAQAAQTAKAEAPVVLPEAAKAAEPATPAKPAA